MSPHDIADMMEEMGICPYCHDHTPCGCDVYDPEDVDEFDSAAYAIAKGRAV